LLGRDGGTYDFGARSGPKMLLFVKLVDLISTEIPKKLTESRSFSEFLCGDDNGAFKLVTINHQKSIGHGVS
jgi:hypothetical protein